MQTFLPYASFTESARCLDNKRLGKQRVEVLQLLNSLCGLSKGWRYHPALKMWRGYEGSLLMYEKAICCEWTSRGYKDTCWEKCCKALHPGDGTVGFQAPPPPWFGDERLHASHRSNLLRKQPEHYSQFGWAEGPDLPYYWPGAASAETRR